MIGKEKSDIIWQEIGNKKEANFLRAIHGKVHCFRVYWIGCKP